ncbi:MAG: hypothetical protein ACI9OH_003237 [Oleispira sp.]|jgi:hypothetical protein
MFRSFLTFNLFALCVVLSNSAVADAATTDTVAAAEASVELIVIDTYLEMHSGPGRGYPIIHTMEQDEPITVLRRRGSWYQVANRHLRKGWIQQEKLARTIAPSGLPAALPDTQHGDYLAQQGRIGFALGQQGSAETASLVAGFRLFSFVGAEFELGQIFGTDTDGNSYGGNLLFEPIQSWSFTPFISTGYGQQVREKKEKQGVGKSNELNYEYNFVGGGINYYIGYNFVVRGEYRQVSITGDTVDNNTVRSSAWRIGFSSFF